MYFRTEDEKSRLMNQGSHGIGLNVCKRVAKLLGGDLYLNEEYTEGARFTLDLILQRAGPFQPVKRRSEDNIGDKDLFKIYEESENLSLDQSVVDINKMNNSAEPDSI